MREKGSLFLSRCRGISPNHKKKNRKQELTSMCRCEGEEKSLHDKHTSRRELRSRPLKEIKKGKLVPATETPTSLPSEQTSGKCEAEKKTIFMLLDTELQAQRSFVADGVYCPSRTNSCAIIYQEVKARQGFGVQTYKRLANTSMYVPSYYYYCTSGSGVWWS